MRVELVRGDITELTADAIVNAANEQLVLGSGVAGAIRTRGGPAIQKECDRLAPVPTGGAVATTAGNLPHRYVIHAVAPHISLVDWEARLERAVHAVLKLADTLQLAHVGLPALGTGVFGLPIGRAARIMLTAVYNAPPLEHVQQVTFCLFDDNALRAFDQAHQTLLARARHRENQARQAQERQGQGQDRDPGQGQDWSAQDYPPDDRQPGDRQPGDRQPNDHRHPNDRQPNDRQHQNRPPREQRHGQRPPRHRHGRGAPTAAPAGSNRHADDGFNAGADEPSRDLPPEGDPTD